MSENQADQYFAPPHDVFETKQLPDELFIRWWSALDETDRVEFTSFYQGDKILAKFVCVLDYLIMQKIKGNEEQLFSLAYYIATRDDPNFSLALNNPAIRTRAQRAWQHPAVQALMDRVRYRSTRQAVYRIKNLAARNVESMLDQANRMNDNGEPVMAMKDQGIAANAAIKFIEVTKSEEVEIVATRTKLGLENARKALAKNEDEVEPKVLEAYIKLGSRMLGEERVKELLGGSD